MELMLMARRRGSIPILGRILDVVNGNRSVNEIIELHDFDYNNVKVEIELQGHRKTIDLSNVQKLRSYYDVTSLIQIGTNGHPIFSSIDEAAIKLLNDLSSAIGTGDFNV